jgi:hypothetical protein
MAPIKKTQNEKTTNKKAKITYVGRVLRSAASANKALWRVAKLLRACTPRNDNEAMYISRSKEALSEGLAADEKLRQALLALEDLGYFPPKTTKVRTELAAEVRVWVKPKFFAGYAEAYSADQMDDLYVDRITTSGKILVRIGAPPSQRMIGFVTAGHLTTNKPDYAGSKVRDAA